MTSITSAQRTSATDLERAARALQAAVADLVRVYQFRDRDRICCHDISVTQCHALEALVEHGPMRLSELTERLFLDKSTTSRVVHTLVKKGYVAQRPDATDGRATALHPTTRGRRLCERITDDLVEQQKQLLQDLDPQIREGVVNVIRQVARAADSRFRSGVSPVRTPVAALPATAVRAADLLWSQWLLVPIMSIAIREAGEQDAAAIASIYNQGIDDRGATFETEPRSASDMAAKLAERGRSPMLVITEHDLVLGWAGLSSYRSRACYGGIGEFSIYLDRTARGRGLGRQLLTALIDVARERGYWKLVSRIFPANAASRALCIACGFREVGIYEKHGRLDGQWRDVVIVERLIPENVT